jgi:hypothetical protein
MGGDLTPLTPDRMRIAADVLRVAVDELCVFADWLTVKPASQDRNS